VGFDQDKDVAVLKIDAPKEKLRPMPIGISADLLVGQKVFAIGNPVCNFLASQPFDFSIGYNYA
jgi:S1-C subfamily serine protease